VISNIQSNPIFISIINDKKTKINVLNYFRSKLRYPARITIVDRHGVDEPSQDTGGPRDEALSLSMKDIAEQLPSLQRLWYEYIDDQKEGTGELSGKRIGKRLKTAGILSAMGVMQCGLFEPYVWEWINQLKRNRHNPFITGLDVFGLATVK
jgi:hypothetical protein